MRAFAACVCACASAVGCVPMLEVERAPCDEDKCAAGYSCCAGVCVDAAEPCLGACADPVSGIGEDRYQPFVPGSVWIYEVTASDTGQFDRYKHVRLGAEEDLEPFATGRAHRLCREDRGLGDSADRGSIRWERDTGAGAVWVRNVRIDASGVTEDELTIPFAVRIDETSPHLCVGAAFDASWTSRTVDEPASCAEGPTVCASSDVAVSEEWEVEAIDEPIDVPDRGALPSLRVRRTKHVEGIEEISTFWFVRGVGKVFEVVPTDETERLIYFDIPGVGSGGSSAFRPLGECNAEWWPGF